MLADQPLQEKQDEDKARLVFDITARSHLPDVSYQSGLYVTYDSNKPGSKPETTFIYTNTTSLVNIIMNCTRLTNSLNVMGHEKIVQQDYQTGRRPLLRAVYSGVIVAVLLSVVLGVVLTYFGGLTPIWEGSLALLAAVLVITCTLHMLRHGKRMKQEITSRLQRVSGDTSLAATVAVFAFILLMVGREGIETATMLAALITEGGMHDLVTGGVLGVLCAATMAWAWLRYGRSINLSRFFNVTAIFMVLFSVQLVIYAFHEFSEVQALPFLDNTYWHNVSEPYGPEGSYGQWLSYSLVLVPGFYLLMAWLRERMQLGAAPSSA